MSAASLRDLQQVTLLFCWEKHSFFTHNCQSLTIEVRPVWTLKEDVISQQRRELNKGASQKKCSATLSCLSRRLPLGKLPALCLPKVHWVLPMSCLTVVAWESQLQHLKLILMIRHGEGGAVA